MKLRLIFGFAVLTLVISVSKVSASAYVWTGATSTNWGTGSNWKVGGTVQAVPPTSNDDVTISAYTNAPIVNVTSVCKSLTISAGTTLTLSANLTISGGITVSGGLFYLATGSNFTIAASGAFTTNNGASIAVVIGANNTITCASISQGQQTAFANAGTLTATGAFSSGQQSSFTNTGHITCGTGFSIGQICSFSNPGTINAATFFEDQQSSFSNAGSITCAGNFTLGSLIGTAASPATSSGTITENSGTFTIGQQSFLSSSGTIAITGIFNIVTQSALFNSGTFSVSGAATIGQQSYINCTAGPMTFSSTLSIVTQGYFKNAGTVSVYGNVSIGQASYINNSNWFTTNTGADIAVTTQGYILNSGVFSSVQCDVSLGQQSYIKNLAGATYYLYSGSTVAFVTQAYIDNAGTFYGGISQSNCTFNLTTQSCFITNSAASGKFYLGSTSFINLTGTTAYVNNASGATFTLQSDQYGSATIEAIKSGAYTTGTFNVERFIYGNNNLARRNYRLFSSPVYTSSQTLGVLGSKNVFDLKYLNNAAAAVATNPITTGPGGTGDGFNKTGNPTIYLYREDRNQNNNVFSGGNYIGLADIRNTLLGYVSYNNTTTAGYLPVGNGFAFFYRGSNASAAILTGRTTTPISSAYYPDNSTVTQVGQINQNNISVILWYKNSIANSYQDTLSYTTTNTTTRGFNLVGNPYPSSIDWSNFSNSVTTANIYGKFVNPTAYEFDPGGSVNVFGTYNALTSTALNNGNKVIVSGEGFFVQTNAARATLQFTESAKSNTQLVAGSTLLMGTPASNTAYGQDLRLSLSKNQASKTEVLIGFNSTSTDNYNGQEDDSYFSGFSATQNLWLTSIDNVKLVSKWMALPNATQSKTIKLNVSATASGQFTLTRTELKAIPDLYDIWLMDNYKKDSLDIKHNTTYVFDLDLADTNSFGSNRFRVIIRQNPSLMMHLLNFTAIKATNGAQIAWKTENEQNYTNFTVQRSTDNGKTFNDLTGFISTGAGTYSFLDKNPGGPSDRYRLKLVDLNGTISYSNVVTLMYSNLNNNMAGISIYPNPATGVINLSINENKYLSGVQTNIMSGNLSALQNLNLSPALVFTTTAQSYEIKIISISGTVVKTATSAQPTWQDNVGSLLPGTYIIQVLNNIDKSLVGKSTFIKL